jgi:hypothetical protein
MACAEHQKKTTMDCEWCGKELCEECVEKAISKKRYCASCAQKLGGMLDQQKNLHDKEKQELQKRQNEINTMYE